MTKAILFGSMGVLADTSDIQRRSYNQALEEAGLGWQWDEATYRDLLKMSGGKHRLQMLAKATGTNLSSETIDTIHSRKTELACDEIVRNSTPLRPGVASLIAFARGRGLKIGIVSGTSRTNLEAVAEAAGDDLTLDEMDLVIDRDSGAGPKPSPEPYLMALNKLGVDGADCVAIEDTADSAASAIGAGLRVIVTGGAYTSDQVVVGADLRVESLGSDDGSIKPGVLELIGD